MSVKVIYNCRDIVLMSAEGGFTVCSAFGGADEDGAILGRDKRQFRNPLEAFDYWLLLVDAAGRRSIGEYLEREGRNPYTGKLDKQAIAEACGNIKKDR